MTFLKSKLFSVITPVVLLVAATNGSAVTNLVTGTISTNRTLAGTNLLTGTVTVANGAILTIDPGTRMLMNTGATLRVEGQLLANGTAADPIHFTRATTAARWARLRFVAAEDSRLRHCIIEYANCVGTHLDYYDDDCNTNTADLVRPPYHEAVVVLASHVDIEGCIFRNLPEFPTPGTAPEGDAIAVIADDPTTPGLTSAHIWNSQFISIGQGIHSRYSYLLVENCFFTNHFGDNDDIDLYGESMPVPLIRNNVFINPDHDDMINPTRCSAIIMGNIIAGGDDHGIVLRDKCAPIVINNLIYNVAAAGISVQNQCNALIINNTIVNCARGVRFFDHGQPRWIAPYCLFRGSGTATIVNCIIWDCPTPFDLAESSDTTPGSDRGSHATVISSNIEGGQAGSVVSASSTLTWGAGNINADPLFTNSTNYHLRAGSPSIDTGTNAHGMWTNLSLVITNDLDGLPRPLDGNGDSVARFDMGAYEFLLATGDSNGDGIPDEWTRRYGFNPTDPNVAGSNPDQDPHSTYLEWLADTDPTNALSYFRILGLSNVPPTRVYFPSSSNRNYTLFSTTNLALGPSLTVVPGQTNVPGTGAVRSLTDTNTAMQKFYRVGVSFP